MSWDLLAELGTAAPAPTQQAHVCTADHCYQTVTPTASWHCPQCGAYMRWGHKHDNCPRCGEWAFFHRSGDRYFCHCRCSETEEQRKVREHEDRLRARREAKEAEELQRAAERRKEAEQLRSDTRKAKNCWENEKRRVCAVTYNCLGTMNQPKPFCGQCPKFKRDRE